MNPIKSYISTLAGSALTLVALASIPMEAHAFPFAENCSSMEKYYNTRSWSTKTSFSGFSSARWYSTDTYATCEGGYVTETSPMGTRVCYAMLSYMEQAGGAMWHSAEPAKEHCRWKN